MNILGRGNAKKEREAREKAEAAAKEASMQAEAEQFLNPPDGPHTPIEYVDSKELGKPKVDVVPVSADGKAIGTKKPTAAEQLEQAVERQTRASKALGKFVVHGGMKTLLARALDNVGKNNGDNLDDEGAKAKANAFAAITIATGYDLSLALQVIAESETPTRMAGTVYSYCYTVLKAAIFIGNLDYRRALDPNGDLDPELYTGKSYVEEALAPPNGMKADQREERRDSVPGLQPEDLEEPIEEQIMQALTDLQLFLTLIAESYGWVPRDTDGEPNAQLIPFDNTMDASGKFDPIFGVEQALDRQEVKRKLSQAKRRDAFNTMAANAKAVAAKLVADALRSKH